MICNSKYHFLVPSNDTITACLSYQGNCAETHSKVKLDNLVELDSHIMHGVFHSNGFGHLLCINGVETGSDLAGHQIMEFWDRLCTGLHARKVSLIDNSKKKSMDFRLLHGVAYGEPWFGRWGYKFGRGSFGVTQQMYQNAIEAIRFMPLCLVAHHFGSSNIHDISILLSKYQILSGHSLMNLRDLFCFMLELKVRLPRDGVIDSYAQGIIVDTNCRWSPKRVQMATRVIVESLKLTEFRWVSRQEIRDSARAYIGDTGLLDFVLKSLGNHMVGNYLVRRCLNPVTKVLEYCLEDVSNVFQNQVAFLSNDSKIEAGHKISRIQLLNEMLYLYTHIIKEQKSAANTEIFATMQVASKIILDTKLFVKEYCGELSLTNELRQEDKSKLYCTITLNKGETDIKKHDEFKTKSCASSKPFNDGEGSNGLNVAFAPYECVMLKNDATFDELVEEVQSRFREMYWGLRSFLVQSILKLKVEGQDFVFVHVKPGSKLIFEGAIEESGISHESICESIKTGCIVDCPCGTKYEDGERMVSCDICDVWQHTRCSQIPNSEDIPNIFICSQCEQDILFLPSVP